jgi:hypothetical protein
MAEKNDYQLVMENVWAADSTITASNQLGKVPAGDGGELCSIPRHRQYPGHTSMACWQVI